jgi:predicted alpha/beta-hydrolase family hydrolase
MSHTTSPSPVELRFIATAEKGEVSALLLRPEEVRWLFVLGHGAGAGMRHPFMEGVSAELAEVGIATFRYQFPYMERGKGGLDSEAVRLATVRSAVAAAAQAAPDLPLLAGGKSMGGRMTSLAMAEAPLPGVQGLVFLGFPLHPTGKPGAERGAHLQAVTVPMLFLQGDRDKLADLHLLRPICQQLGRRATLHVVDTADHSFKVLKRSGKTEEQVLAELAQAIAGWTAKITKGYA